MSSLRVLLSSNLAFAAPFRPSLSSNRILVPVATRAFLFTSTRSPLITKQSKRCFSGGATPATSDTHTMLPDYGTPNFGITKKLGPGIDMEEAIDAVTASLKKVGFGILTTIDIKETLKKKIDKDIQPYVILGACNPKLAHKALSSMPAVGLLLPCNVVVTKDASDGNVVVSAMDPMSLFSVIDDPGVAELAEEVKALVQSAIDAL